MVGHYVRPNWNMYEKIPVLVGKCLMSDHYFKHCYRCLDREICVKQRNFYFTVIGHELWQFETRRANARNLMQF